MKSLLCCISLLLALQSTDACINGPEPKPEPPEIRSAAKNLKLALEKDLTTEGASMELAYRGGTDFDQRNGYAVALMYLGRSKEAVTLLEKLERERPGQYSIAANLGTAYELSGDNQAALRWIKEGIRRDPTSHHGTEWLHVNILEAKIAHAKNPQHFENNSVLNLQRSADGNTRYFVVSGRAMPTADITKALEYQLGERLQFVKGPDMPVASLLHDYAVIEATGNTLESARDVLKLAIQFGYPQAQGQPLLNSYNREILWGKAKGMLTTMGLAALVLCVLGFLFVKWVNRPIYA